MAMTTVYRFNGATYLLSVGAASHAAVTIQQGGNDQANYAAFLNTGTNPVAINIAPASAGAAVLPVDGAGSATCSFVLPAAMTMPMVVAVPLQGAPAGQFSVTAIGTAAGPASVYITTMGDQS
jgi:hypothetical protein